MSREKEDWITTLFDNHKASERRSISWHMNSVDAEGRYKSAYAYAVTWTPGTLCISGDIGEFTVTHYSAMRTIEGTLGWLDGIEFSYLMSKSTAQEVYDEDETFAEIIRMANEDALHSLKSLREDRGNHRAACVYARAEWQDAVREWESSESGGAAPVITDYLPDDGGLPQLKIGKSPRGNPKIPDGWELWYRIWKEVDGYGNPNCIFTSVGRSDLKDHLRRSLSSEDEAIDLCSMLKIDDFYGYRKYPTKCRVWHAAIRAWVAIVKRQYQDIAP
jgi:hypothetical protein